MPLTFSDLEPLIRILWQSDNGKWSLRRISHNGHRKYDLKEARHGQVYNYASVYRDGQAIGCDYPGDLPAYVVAALYKHFPAYA